ncbi:MAG: hypothetical protein AAB336_01700, partial [Acidobacteriota bacterium]
QVEIGYGLLRVLDITQSEDGEKIWHISAYNELFPDVEFADAAINAGLTISVPHVALTNRAFESTQVSKMENKPLRDDELTAYQDWDGEISDRSIRLIMGLR